MTGARSKSGDKTARRSRTDWDAVDAKTNAEILEDARSDPDSFVPTENELTRFKRVRPDGLGERAAEYRAEGQAVAERDVALRLLQLVLLEIQTAKTLEHAKATAEAVYNAPLRLNDERQIANTIVVIRQRAAKLGVSERLERLIDVATQWALKPSA